MPAILGVGAFNGILFIQLFKNYNVPVGNVAGNENSNVEV